MGIDTLHLTGGLFENDTQRFCGKIGYAGLLRVDGFLHREGSLFEVIHSRNLDGLDSMTRYGNLDGFILMPRFVLLGN